MWSDPIKPCIFGCKSLTVASLIATGPQKWKFCPVLLLNKKCPVSSSFKCEMELQICVSLTLLSRSHKFLSLFMFFQTHSLHNYLSSLNNSSINFLIATLFHSANNFISNPSLLFGWQTCFLETWSIVLSTFPFHRKFRIACSICLTTPPGKFSTWN